MAITSIPAATPVVASSRVDADATARRPQRVVFARTARQAMRSGAIWGAVFGIYTALQAIAYTSTYKTLTQRLALAKSLSLSGGLNALAGPARDLQTVGGYTVWKSLGFLSVVGAIWALLLGTKLLRGEEESGRSELLLGGPLTQRDSTVQILLGLAVGVVAMFVCTSFFVLLVGREHAVHWAASASLYYALSATCGAALFMAVGAFTSQLVTSRRRAAAYAGGALGVAFAIRMVSDASTGATWMHWLTPLGWVEKLGAFTSPSPVALLPLAGATAILAAATIWLSGARDLDAGLLRERTTARAHTALLGGPVGLATRLSGPIITVWVAGVAAYALLLGAVADTAAKALEDSPSVKAALARLGGHVGLVKAYLGVSCLLLTLLVMLLAASQLTAARREEASGRAEHLLGGARGGPRGCLHVGRDHEPARERELRHPVRRRPQLGAGRTLPPRLRRARVVVPAAARDTVRLRGARLVLPGRDPRQHRAPQPMVPGHLAAAPRHARTGGRTRLEERRGAGRHRRARGDAGAAQVRAPGPRR